MLAGAAIVTGAASSIASADGLPVLGVDVGSTGVTVPGAVTRYVTLRSGPRSTVVARVARDGGRIVRSKILQGTFTIPAVAYDRSASGLSADGRVLVLIQPRLAFPRARHLVRDPRRADAAPATSVPAARRLQLRRHLAEWRPHLPDQLPLGEGSDEVRRARLRPWRRPPAGQTGRGSARGRRADARPADLPGRRARTAAGRTPSTTATARRRSSMRSTRAAEPRAASTSTR